MCNHTENERAAVKGSGRLVRGFQEAGLTASDAQADRWQSGLALACTQGKVMCTRPSQPDLSIQLYNFQLVALMLPLSQNSFFCWLNSHANEAFPDCRNLFPLTLIMPGKCHWKNAIKTQRWLFSASLWVGWSLACHAKALKMWLWCLGAWARALSWCINQGRRRLELPVTLMDGCCGRSPDWFICLFSSTVTQAASIITEWEQSGWTTISGAFLSPPSLI